MVKDFQQSDIDAVFTMIDAGGDFEVEKYLKSNKRPTLIVQGAEDFVAFKDVPNIQTAFHPNTHYIELDGAGYFPMMDNRNKFNRLVIDFLALRSGESPRNLQLKDEWIRRVR